jgi:methylenetetrahydrofolate reductase (NADPH)
MLQLRMEHFWPISSLWEYPVMVTKALFTETTDPPVFDRVKFEPFHDRLKTLGVPIIPTVFLIKSVGVARYIATNEPSAGITEDLIRRIRKSFDRELECVKIAGETVAALRQKVQGVRIVTLGWEHRLSTILDHAGL